MADSDRRVVRVPLRSATTRRKNELDKARLATRVTLKNQKGRWDRLKTVLKKKDSEVADILFDTLVHFLIIITILGLARVSASDRYPEPRPYAMAMSHVVPSHNSGLTPVKLFPECGFMCNSFMNVCI